MRPDFSMMVLAISLSCVSFGSITATPVLTRDTFEAGDPISEKEFSTAIFSKAAEFDSDDFILWDKQHPDLFEGDIEPTGKKNAIISPAKFWPNAKIPYVISASYTAAQRQVIAFAMNEFHKRTCIRFVPRTNSETDYVQITNTGSGCWSAIGRKAQGGRQTVSLGDHCTNGKWPGFVIHELMHTVGFLHEHTRPDRDTYVSINLDNVKPEYRSKFDKLSPLTTNTLGLPYDYGSVMHYPKVAFAVKRHVPVIKALKGDPVLGQRAGFSAVVTTFSDIGYRKLAAGDDKIQPSVTAVATSPKNVYLQMSSFYPI